jgi:hypothetical protein
VSAVDTNEHGIQSNNKDFGSLFLIMPEGN